MASPGEFVPEYIVTANDMNALPGGVLGYAEITSNKVNITGETDITGLSVTFTVPAGRLTRLSFMGRVLGTVADNEIAVRFRDASDTLYVSAPVTNATTAGRVRTLTAQRVVGLSVGEHTIRVTGQRTSGTGAVEVVASAASPAGFLVEDIGPA